MASPPLPRPTLDGPPPSPANPPSSGFQGLGPGSTPPGAAPAASPAQGARAAVQMGAEIDRALTALAQAVPAGAAEFGQAKNLVRQGLAKFLSQQGVVPATSATAAGPQFPGSTGVPR